MKDRIGFALIILGLAGLGWIAVEQQFVRFADPKLTETELTLWALVRWWRWVIPVVMIFYGSFLLSRKSK